MSKDLGHPLPNSPKKMAKNKPAGLSVNHGNTTKSDYVSGNVCLDKWNSFTLDQIVALTVILHEM